MRQTFFLLCGCIGIATIFLLPSCVKPPRDFDPRDADNVYTGCRIKQISTVGQYASFTRLFAYNGNNDPVSVYGPAGPGLGSTGAPALTFTYDGKHRLIEYAGPYGNGYYEFLHRYTWQADKIVVDSEYNFGPVNGPLPLQAAYRYLRYDKYDRVSQDSIVYIGFNLPPTVNNYNYDADGNQVGPSKQYDNKLNPHRLNRVWMFIDRDYSVNNPIAASAYNSAGLPLTPALRGYFLGSYYDFTGTTNAVYDCK